MPIYTHILTGPRTDFTYIFDWGPAVLTQGLEVAFAQVDSTHDLIFHFKCVPVEPHTYFTLNFDQRLVGLTQWP